MLIKFPAKISDSETTTVMVRYEAVRAIRPHGKSNTYIFVVGIKTPYIALIPFSVTEKFFNRIGIKVEDLEDESNEELEKRNGKSVGIVAGSFTEYMYRIEELAYLAESNDIEVDKALPNHEIMIDDILYFYVNSERSLRGRYNYTLEFYGSYLKKWSHKDLKLFENIWRASARK